MARTMTPGEFEALYRAVAPELVGYLRRRGTTEAEDLVAEVFTIAWRRLPDLPPPVLRRAWLFGTARRLLLADGRRSRQDQALIAHLAGRPDDDAPSDPPAEGIVTRALGRLSSRDREIIQLAEWERLTPAEIAIVLGIKPGTARVRLHRARQALASDPDIQGLVRRSSAAARALTDSEVG